MIHRKNLRGSLLRVISSWRLRASLVVCAVVGTIAVDGVAAQQPAITPAPESRRVEGQVEKPRISGADSAPPQPVAGVMVTLHRVGRDVAGPLDSVRTTASGKYSFSYRTSGADAVYFASVTYGGIAYFTAPFRDAVVRDESANIMVFDTTSTRFPLQVRGRHLIVGAIDSTDKRTVIEVFELENDSIRTLVARDSTAGEPTWSSTIPESAADFRINDSEISADAFVRKGNRVDFFAPFAPGLKQLSFSYRVDASVFPIAITTDHAIDVFEVLLEESVGKIVHPQFTVTGNVNLEGRTFQRFLAQDVAAAERIVVDLPDARPFSGNLYIASLLIVIGAAMLLMLMRTMSRSRPTATTPVSLAKSEAPKPPLHEQLAREIAALDDVFARTPDPSDDVRDAYQRRRAELRDALAGALAESGAAR